MIGFSRDWRRFWDRQKSPLHAKDNEAFYSSYGRELRVLLDSMPRDRVLEIGCGNGALYRPLGFDDASEYRGVDLSESMLSQFRALAPGVELSTGDGAAYRDQHKYELVFSNGVVQNFSKRMLEEHVGNAVSMLAPGGSIFMAMIPWRNARYAFQSGQMTGHPSAGVVQYAKSFIRRLTDDRMGRWIGHQELMQVGRRHGLETKLFGSLHYPYRLHAVFSRPLEERAKHEIRQAA